MRSSSSNAMKSSAVSIKTRSTPASLTIQGQVTKDTTVKWSIGKSGVQVKKEDVKFTVVCSCSLQNLLFGFPSLLFCRGWQRIVPKCKTHVQNDCFCSFRGCLHGGRKILEGGTIFRLLYMQKCRPE